MSSPHRIAGIVAALVSASWIGGLGCGGDDDGGDAAGASGAKVETGSSTGGSNGPAPTGAGGGSSAGSGGSASTGGTGGRAGTGGYAPGGGTGGRTSGGAGTQTNPAACPTAMPELGGLCTAGGPTCRYGTCTCRCLSGGSMPGWDCDGCGTDVDAAPPSACPDSLPASTSPCAERGLFCMYNGNTTACSCGNDSTWQCQ